MPAGLYDRRFNLPSLGLEKAMAVFFASLSSPANTITHLGLEVERMWVSELHDDHMDDDHMDRSIQELGHLLRSTSCKLLCLRLRFYKEVKSDKLRGIGHIAQALQVNTTLTTLFLEHFLEISSRSMAELAAMFLKNATLQAFGLRSCGMSQKARAYLRRGLCSPRSGSLTALDFHRTDFLGDGDSRSKLWIPCLRDMLANHASIQILNISCCRLCDGAGRDLAEGLRTSSLEKLEIRDNPELSAQDMVDIFGAVETHTTLKTFQCDHLLTCGWEEQGVEAVAHALAQMISRNQSLHKLTYNYAPFSASQWSDHILPGLVNNRTLQIIKFDSCKGLCGDEVFQALLRIVRSKTVIQRLDLYGTPLHNEGKVEVILQKLRLTREFRITLSALPTSKPASARIILCGREYAGKSTLLRTIQHLNTPSHLYVLKQVLGKCKQGLLCSHDKGRTRGVDIHLLDEIAGTRIHVWDLAGQREFHALYDFMLCSNANSATLFVFTYSPIVRPIVAGARELKSVNRFKQELLYWLQFVASKSEPNVKPHVVVVITNKDKVVAHFKKRPNGYRDWEVGVKNTIAAVVAQEDNIANFVCLDSEPLIVNIRDGPRTDRQLVKKWMDTNIKALQDTLSNLEEVPAICDTVGRAMSLSQTCPLISKDDFFKICAEELQKSTTSAIPSEVMRLQSEVVGACLYHFGEIIYDKDLHFIVRNPQWFSYGILGHLLDLFAEDAAADRTDHLPKNGFMTRMGLCHLLRRASEKVPGLGQQQLDANLFVDDLIKLMILLHLCYEQRPNDPRSTGYFIPATFDDTFDDEDQKATKGMRSWEWETPMEGPADNLVGKRLQCAHPTTTFLVDDFFPRV